MSNTVLVQATIITKLCAFLSRIAPSLADKDLTDLKELMKVIRIDVEVIDSKARVQKILLEAAKE
jgi:hypothetical protein